MIGAYGAVMRKLIVNTFLSLDGVMQAPGGPEEDPTAGFEYGGWSVNYWDEVMGEVMSREFAEPFDLLLGRKTYEIFAAHWPHVDEPGAAELNAATKYVASTTLSPSDLSWEKSVLLEGELGPAVEAAKATDGPDLHVHGSSDLIQGLLAADVIDEFRLVIFPLVLGPGKRLFGAGTVPAGLKLVASTVSTTGVFLARYERAGAISVGSFALEEPTEAEVERRASLR